MVSVNFPVDGDTIGSAVQIINLRADQGGYFWDESRPEFEEREDINWHGPSSQILPLMEGYSMVGVKDRMRLRKERGR